MGNWLRSVVSHIVANLLFWGVPLVVGLLAWLQSVPWYIIALSTIIAFGAIFWGKNQFDVFRERRKKGFANQSDPQIEDVVHQWIDKPSFSIRREILPEAHFQFVLTDPQGRPVAITRLKNEPTQLQLSVRILLTEEQQCRIATFQESIRSGLISKLRVEMARFGIGFQDIEHPLKQIILIETISLDDSLTNFYLMQRIMFVRRASVLIAELITQALKPIGVIESTEDKEGS